MVGAAAVLNEEMKSRGISPNLITYTTLLKGYCETGQLDKSSEIFFHAMKTAAKTNTNNKNHNQVAVNLTPNVRSLNTFLRGCSRIGAIASATKAYSYFNALPKTSSNTSAQANLDSDDEGEGDDGQSGSQADASTFEYLVGILAMAGNMAAAEAVVADFITSGGGVKSNKAAGGVDVIENAAIYLYLAKAYALCGSLAHAKKWLLLASSAVKVNQNATLKDNMRKRFQGESAPKETSASKSVALFLNHRRTEIQNELQLLEDYILNVESSAGPSAPVSGEEFRTSACILNLRYLSQVLYFGFDGQCDADVASEASTGENNLLLTALKEKFGLDRIDPQNSSVYERVSGGGSAALASSFSIEKTRVVEKLTKAVDAVTGHINFEELFPQFITAADWNEETHKAELSLPLKLEICSGNGEWVVAQAAADRGAFSSAAAAQSDVKALWLALELRCDRVHNTMCQHAFSTNDLAKAQLTGADAPNRNNLAVIGGDASKILPFRFPAARLSAIFVNHPQPPEQRANEKDKKKGGEGSGSHLLTVDFFAQMHRTLSAEGTVTIVTDNQFYVKLLADSLVEMAQKAKKIGGDGIAFVSRPLEGDITRNLQESLPINPPPASQMTGKKGSTPSGPSIEIWRGEPGQDAGHVASGASSYFDRMWDLGQKKRRYFLFLGKL
eukprot:gene25110-31525_t